MPEAHAIAEEAARYVLDELSPRERRRFEAQLEHSEALRAQVRQLEEGALALALTCPRHQPPKAVWQGIEQALNRETRTESVLSFFRFRFWRNGWAVATACLVGWGISVWFLHRPGQPSRPPLVVATTPSSRTNVPVVPALHRPAEPAPPAVGPDHVTAQLLKAKAEEIGALRWQVATSSNHLAQLSEVLTQQQAQLSSPGHFKFFQLTPSAGAGAPAAPISPNLQRALVLAMAQELGWLGPAAPGQMNGTSDGSEAPWGVSGLPGYATNINFVDLRSGTNHTERALPPGTEADAQRALEVAAQTSPSGGSAAGFVSGNTAVVALDDSVAPRGSSVSFWVTSSSGQSHSVGETTLGDKPTVVALSAGDGSGLTVLATWPGGSNVLHGSAAGATPP